MWPRFKSQSSVVGDPVDMQLKTNQKQQTPKEQKTLQIVVSLMIFGCHFNMFNNAYISNWGFGKQSSVNQKIHVCIAMWLTLVFWSEVEIKFSAGKQFTLITSKRKRNRYLNLHLKLGWHTRSWIYKSWILESSTSENWLFW